MAITCIYRCFQFRSLANCYLPIAYEGEGIALARPIGAMVGTQSRGGSLDDIMYVALARANFLGGRT